MRALLVALAAVALVTAWPSLHRRWMLRSFSKYSDTSLHDADQARLRDMLDKVAPLDIDNYLVERVYSSRKGVVVLSIHAGSFVFIRVIDMTGHVDGPRWYAPLVEDVTVHEDWGFLGAIVRSHSHHARQGKSVAVFLPTVEQFAWYQREMVPIRATAAGTVYTRWLPGDANRWRNRLFSDDRRAYLSALSVLPAPTTARVESILYSEEGSEAIRRRLSFLQQSSDPWASDLARAVRQFLYGGSERDPVP